MSRDFTPRELYYVNKSMDGKLSNSVITWTLNGKQEVKHDPKSELGQTYPNMYFLCQELLENAIKYNVSKEKLKDIEDAISFVIAKDEQGIDTSEWANQDSIAEPLKTVSKWFHGNLDSSFYYNEYNNEVFLNFIKDGKWNISEEKSTWKPHVQEKDKGIAKDKDNELNR